MKQANPHVSDPLSWRISNSKIVHQIWLGTNPLPVAFVKWMDSVKIGFPGWEVKLWRDGDVKELLPYCLAEELLDDESLGMGIRPDVLRYELLRLFGGVYADLDYEFFQNMEELLVEDCAHIGCYSATELGTGLLASSKGHPFWAFLLYRLRAAEVKKPQHWTGVLDITGPKFLQRCTGLWLADNWNGTTMGPDEDSASLTVLDHGDMVIWQPDAVCPYHISQHSHREFEKSRYPKAYAAHHWFGSWI